MEDHGLVIQAGGLGYVLGPRLLGLATTAMRELPLRELAHPILGRVARSTGESAQLFVRDGDRRICVDAAESESELRTIVEIGASLPLTLGSAGRSSSRGRAMPIANASWRPPTTRIVWINSSPRPGVAAGPTASRNARPASPR